MPEAPRPVSPPVRALAALAVLTVVGTFLAAQIDFVRRNTLGLPPVDVKRYYLPQLTHIWAPGLGSALLLAAVAVALHRARRTG